jgi:hypothetical protein
MRQLARITPRPVRQYGPQISEKLPKDHKGYVPQLNPSMTKYALE